MQSKRPFQQSPEFASALAALGRRPLTLGGHVILRRRFLGVPVHMASRITLCNPDALPPMPKTPLILSPDHPASWLFSSSAVPLMTPATVAELGLSAPPDVLLARQHQKWRNRLRHAEKHNLMVAHAPMPNDITHWLYTWDIKEQKAKRYRNYPMHLILAFTRQGQDNSRLFTASKDGEIVAAMLFLRHGPVASYMIGHSTAQGRRLSAHTLLLWQAALWLGNQGHTRLDLGVIDTDTSPGLARFKLGSGAVARPLGGTWLILPGCASVFRRLARWDRQLFQSTTPACLW